MIQINKHFGAVIGLVVVAFLCLFSSADVSAGTYSLSMTSSGAQILNATTTGDGVTIGADAIGVTTTCRYGYNFVINTSVNDNNLYLAGNASNNTAGTYFSPVNGTSTLDNSTNAWGYFYNSDSSVIPTKSSVFSPVPALGQTAVIKSASSAAASGDINDSFNLYYGVKTSPTMAPGAYKMIPDTNNQGHDGTIVYQATIADNCMRYTVEFNPTSTAGGTTLSGTGTMSNQNIYEDVATPLTSNSFTAPSGYYFAGWNTAQDGTGTTYTNRQSVTDLTTVGSTITLYAQWTDCPGGKICYKENGANVVGTMGQQTVSDSDTSITLLASNFSRTGYGFAGWSDVEDYATNPNAHFYGPQETLTITAGQYATSGLKLYSVWVQSAGSLQSDTASVCATLTTAPIDGTANLSSVSALTDERDNQTYAIAKLADGKCWMIENLRLDSSASLTLSNTNNPLNDGTNVTLKHSYSDTETHNTLSASQDPTATAWCRSDSASCDDQSMLFTGNTTNRANSPSSYATEIYSYGNYYNWYSATAGRGTYSFGTDNSSVAGDLCPAGWHLPIGGSSANAANSDFWQLGLSTMGFAPASNSYYTSSETNSAGKTASAAFWSYPNNFVYSGEVFGGSVAFRGSYVYFWSSTADMSSSAYYLLLHSSYVYQGTRSGSKYYGMSVRCVAEKPYMQDMTGAKLDALMPNTGDEVTLYDKRDDQAYTVAKLADGNYWMTENLNIAGGTALSSDDTDFDSSYTLPTTNGWTVTNGKLVLPASSTSGFTADNYAYVYNSGNKSGNCDSLGCYSYYSWDAATLGSGRTIGTDNTDANYSICPKNWKLPTSRTTSATNWQTESDFYALAHQYGLDSTTSTTENDIDFYNQAGPGTVPNFLLAGIYSGGSFGSGGAFGNYWSSTSGSSSSSAHLLIFTPGDAFFPSSVSAAGNNSRYAGNSVRCLFGS